jgi:hypothetical protein
MQRGLCVSSTSGESLHAWVGKIRKGSAAIVGAEGSDGRIRCREGSLQRLTLAGPLHSRLSLGFPHFQLAALVELNLSLSVFDATQQRGTLVLKGAR